MASSKILIRTSDRASFRRCRRQWGWSSVLKRGLEPSLKPGPFWLGSGVHYALEDFHSTKLFKSPQDAFLGYCKAYRRTKLSRPDDIKELTELGLGMMEHYEAWLKNRPRLKTFVHKGVHQVEVKFHIPLPVPKQFAHLYDDVVYQGEFDRVVIDEERSLWLVEYKTAAQFELGHFQTDPQVSAYCWAANTLYLKPISGVIYQQHKKKIPNEPKVLSTGKLSTDKSQSTTHFLYRQALVNLYGKVDKAPNAHIDTLNEFAMKESEDHDAFIRRDWITRNDHFCDAEGVKILLELEDMLNPDLPLYPNPTRECSWCNFNSPCVSMDDGSDWEADLLDTTQPRTDEDDRWRRHLRP